VYQSPIGEECSGAPGLARVFSGHQTLVPDVDRPILVFFWSARSGPARRMESLLAHLERKERERLRVRRVDVDASPELAERFRIEIVPTLVLVKEKRAVARLEGRTSAPRIEAMLAPHLAGELAAA
jgi:thioredoxin-like negative regulator of GroEL